MNYSLNLRKIELKYIHGLVLYSMRRFAQLECDILVIKIKMSVGNLWNSKALSPLLFLSSFFSFVLVGCIKKDDQIAVDAYYKAVKYYSGEDRGKDEKKAFEYMEKSAKLGFPKAQNDLASIYSEGVGVEKNPKLTLYWLNEAVKQNFPAAQYNLAIIYDKGELVKKNRNEAVKLYHLSANNGFARAQYNLGNAYLKGNGVVQDTQKAIEYYQKAVEQNLPDAQFNLANIYLDGRAGVVDEKKALDLYTLAANQNFVYAQNNLAHLYLNTYENHIQAKYWYQRAYENGYLEAKQALEQLESLEKK